MSRYILPLLFLALLPLQSQAGGHSTASRRLSSRPMYLATGLGAQTYIGNEDISDARYNGITPNLYVEWGYSLTSEIALGFHLNVFMAKSQTRYRLNPFVDFSQETVGADGYWPYRSFTLCGGTLIGFITLDWTNIISGQDNRQSHLHVYTPVGMGITMTTGAKENPWTDYTPINREFSMMAGLSLDYQISSTVSISCTPRVFLMRGSLDYSPYSNNESARVDIIPTITLGAKFVLDARIPWITR